MLELRAAVPTDVPAIRSLIWELAEYEKEPQQAIATEADLLRDGFGPVPRYRCIMAIWNGESVGFALYFNNYSTWQGRWGLYLEDLFVRPSMRGKGIGKALLVELARIAVRDGCGRFQWQVLDWNKPSIDFYEKLGAKPFKEWLSMRIDGEALERLASHG
ncbi:MAG TPA: GNAT family N-acetyltransferase [Myxococcales bacterium]|jgi:GNAT superfamily N-acetyltransferase|nr:GNAT family N-acetyltransferase [Myxococcales bacterium]